MFGIRPEMVLAATIVTSVYSEFNNAECVITSITDGQHGPKSHHSRVQACLGDEFDVVLEKTHLHVEFDPL